jgi:hypothetical protein
LGLLYCLADATGPRQCDQEVGELLCFAFFFCILIPLISEILECAETRAALRNVVLAEATLLFALTYY